MKMTTYPFIIVSHQCFVINDDSPIWTADYMIGGATTQEQLERVSRDYEFDLDKMPIDMNCLLITTNRRNVLIDAGSGKRPYPG